MNMTSSRYLDERMTMLVPGSDLAVILLSPGYMAAWAISTVARLEDIAAWEHAEWVSAHRKWWKFWKPRYRPTGYTRGGKPLDPDTRIEFGPINLDSDTFAVSFDVNIVSPPITWKNTTIEAEAAVVYQQSTGQLIYSVDFERPLRTHRGSFTITWPKQPVAFEIEQWLKGGTA